MIRLTLPLFAAALIACTGGDTDPDPIDLTCVERADVTTDTEALVDGNNAFAWLLYEQLAGEPGNLFFSPFSISAALGMTYGGARGETAAEMAEVLDIQLDDDAFHATFGALIGDLVTDEGCVVDLAIANRLFGQVDYPWETEFLTLAEEAWAAPLEEADFETDPEGSRERINEWVAEQTRDLIPELVPEGIITGLTRMVLTNAIAFKASWKTQFDPDATYDRLFRAPEGDVMVPMMLEEEGSFRYGQHDGVEVLELPYAGETQSMVVLLPSEQDGLEVLDDWTLDAGTVDALAASVYEVEDMRVELPRFELRSQLNLNQTLETLGMELAFDPDLADLTGLADAPDGNLFIQAVVHEAFIDVDESGTEAAAATAVVVGVESAPPSFIADHPFVFFIRDDVTGSVLFLGRVEDPTAG